MTLRPRDKFMRPQDDDDDDDDEPITFEYWVKIYDLKLDKEFHMNGKAAEWAKDGHRPWGKETHSITLEEADWNWGAWYEGRHMALSPDHKFLAVSTNAAVHFYDLRTRELLSKVDGPEENISRLFFSPVTYPEAKKGYRYVLTAQDKSDWDDGRVYIWYLDSRARLADRNVPFAVHAMADRAVRSIAKDLVQHHSLNMSDLTALRNDVARTLKKAENAQKKKQQHAPIFKAQFSQFGPQTNPISHDGSKILLLLNNQGSYGRPEHLPLDKLPALAVRKLDDLSETWRLVGHDDLIAWAGWSPDDRIIGDACWDETCGLWDSHTPNPLAGQLIGPTGNQNFAGSFSADGQYCIFAGGYLPQVVAYDVASGTQIASLNYSGLKANFFADNVAVSNGGFLVAVVVGLEVVVWEPLKGDDAWSVQFKLYDDGTWMSAINDPQVMKWVEGDRKLMIVDAENTMFIWDRYTNKKWRLQRPKGTMVEIFDLFTADVLYTRYKDEGGMVLTLDSDGKVRYWQLEE